jgi:hypothetical protein
MGETMTPNDAVIGRFGDFELLERLGRDGAFALFRARQVRLDRPVMLKVPVGGPATLEQTAALRREATAANALDHPAIVRVFEAGDHGGRPYLAMAHVEGQRLNRRLKAGPLPWRLAADVARQLAAALLHAHERNIVHGALRPEAIWLTHDGQARLTGFGSPIRFEEIDAKTIAPSAGYLAPEQAGGRGPVGRNTDVYGLGALLYAMLTGVPPHRAATPDATFRLIRDQPPLAPSRLTPDIPESLDEVCLKCLRVDPAKRYGTERPLTRLVADLKRAQSGRSLGGGSDIGSQLLRWSRRHLRLFRTVALLIVFVMIPACWDRHRHHAAWYTLADKDASADDQRQAAQYFQRLHADQPADAEIGAALTLADFRAGRPLPTESDPSAWHSGDEWTAIQQWTRALDAVRHGRKNQGRAILQSAHAAGYEPRTAMERWLRTELERAVGES